MRRPFSVTWLTPSGGVAGIGVVAGLGFARARLGFAGEALGTQPLGPLERLFLLPLVFGHGQHALLRLPGFARGELFFAGGWLWLGGFGARRPLRVEFHHHDALYMGVPSGFRHPKKY